MEWAVGKQGEIMRPNSGKLMLPGSKIVWDIHYSAVGEDITDSVELGIYFYPKGQEPKYRQALALFSGITGGNRALDIQPNSVYVGTNFHVMRKAGRVENFQPHMHLRGKAMAMEAILPTGQTQMLSMVSDFNFNWHNNYVYADDAAPLLPKGTVLKITSWHDNTAANKSNPDPNQWVGWGDRTVDEMAHAWVNITYMDEEDFKAEVEKRKQKAAATTTNHRSSGRSGQGRRARARRPLSFLGPGPVPAPADIGSRTRPHSRRIPGIGVQMSRNRIVAGVAAVAVVCSVTMPGAAGQLPLQPARDAGQSVTAAFEGWYAESRWRSYAAHRILQSQPERDTRYSDRPEQPHRTRRTGLRAAHAFPAAPAVGRLHHQGAEGLRRQATDLDDRGQRPHDLDPGGRHQGIPGGALQGTGAGKRAAEDSVRPGRTGVRGAAGRNRGHAHRGRGARRCRSPLR